MSEVEARRCYASPQKPWPRRFRSARDSRPRQNAACEVSANTHPCRVVPSRPKCLRLKPRPGRWSQISVDGVGATAFWATVRWRLKSGPTVRSALSGGDKSDVGCRSCAAY